jgi:hypothetical protein
VFRRSKASAVGFAGAIGAVSGVTAATRAGVVPVAALASTPRATAEGKLWLLFSSAFVADRPIAASLLAFGGFGIAVLLIAGPKILWSSAIVGHVGSALTVYGAIGAVRLLDPSAFNALLSVADYGTSAMIAAWLGVLAGVTWRRRRGVGARAGVIAFVAVSAAVGWVLRGELTVLDSEHVIAFAVGVAAASQAAARYSARVLNEWSRFVRGSLGAASRLAAGVGAGRRVAFRRRW